MIFCNKQAKINDHLYTYVVYNCAVLIFDIKLLESIKVQKSYFEFRKKDWAYFCTAPKMRCTILRNLGIFDLQKFMINNAMSYV